MNEVPPDTWWIWLYTIVVTMVCKCEWMNVWHTSRLGLLTIQRFRQVVFAAGQMFQTGVWYFQNWWANAEIHGPYVTFSFFILICLWVGSMGPWAFKMRGHWQGLMLNWPFPPWQSEALLQFILHWMKSYHPSAIIWRNERGIFDIFKQKNFPTFDYKIKVRDFEELLFIQCHWKDM